VRIHRIEIENFLSFRSLVLGDVDGTLSVIVGPNAAGKSNLIRALRMVCGAPDAQARRNWERAAHDANREAGFRVSVDLELTDEWEKDLLAVFLQAVLVSREVPDTLRESYVEWVGMLSSDAIADLHRGTVQVECQAGEWWTVSYCFTHGEFRYRWLLDGAPMLGLVRADMEPHARPEAGPPLGHLLHPDMRPEDEMGALTRLHSGPVTLDDVLPRHRDQMIQQLEVSTSWVRGGPPPSPIRRIVQLLGMPRGGERQTNFSGLHVLARLLRRGVLFLDDLRAGPRDVWTGEDLLYPADAVDVGSGANLPLYLFRLKNGPGGDPDQYREIQRIFGELTNETFDVVVEARGEDGELGPEAPPSDRFHLSITVGRARRPIQFAGAGLWEAVLLSTLLAAPADRVLCLDEPALNLHPTRQRQVLSRVRARDGQTIVVTHSPYLIPSRDEADLMRILRFSLDGGSTQVTRLPPPSTPEERDQWRAWLKDLRRGIDMPAMLFAQGVILVEGETEVGALPIWFQKSRVAPQETIQEFNLVMYWVGGRTSFRKYVDFLKAFSVPWVVICDGDAFKDEGFCRAFGLPLGGSVLFSEMRGEGEKRGVFTLSEDFGGFENLPYVDRHLGEAKREVGDSKPRQGRYIAEKSECPDPVKDLYRKILQHLGVKAVSGPSGSTSRPWWWGCGRTG